MTEPHVLPAGDFSSWLRHARHALLVDDGTLVECGECTACCSSSQFIPLRPEETVTLRRINKDILVPAPGLPQGHLLLGYDTSGRCPLLRNGGCSIYEHRPLTCRTYDCRMFAAAGIFTGKPLIDQRVTRWRFSYATASDRDEHLAVQATAAFIREHARCFPGGRIPTDPGQLAVLAVKAYAVLLGQEGRKAGPADETAAAIVAACGRFDAERQGSR